MAKMSVSRGRALGVLVIAVLLVAGCASTKEKEDEEVQRLRARSLYEQGLRALADKNVSLGLTSLKEAVQLDPSQPNYHNALGVVLLDLHKPAEAEAEFQKAVTLDGNYAEAHHNLGLAYAEQGRYEQAIVEYRKAISMPVYSTPEIGYYNLGRAYAQIDKPREAEEALKTAIRLQPTLGAAYYQLGLVYMTTGRKAEAKSMFQKAKDVDPSSPFGQAATEALEKLGEGS